MLAFLAIAMEVPEDRKSALLGRFQHLQRLALIEGINPGRGKAAEYSAHQVLIIAIALQMLQLGLTPERAVDVIKQNQDILRLAIGLAIGSSDTIEPSMIWFDPAILTRSQPDGGHADLAEAIFNYGGAGTGRETFERFFVEGWVQRMSFVSISGTLWHIVGAFDGHKSADVPVIGKTSRWFLDGLKAWYADSAPDSLT